jgi:hypothetical protein
MHTRYCSKSEVNRPVRRLGVDRRYWNTPSTDACEVVDWQGAGTSGRTLWIQGPVASRTLRIKGPVLQDLANTGINSRTLGIHGPEEGHSEQRDQRQDLRNTGINGRTLWIQGPVAGRCEYRDEWQDLVNKGTSGRNLWTQDKWQDLEGQNV